MNIYFFHSLLWFIVFLMVFEVELEEIFGIWKYGGSGWRILLHWWFWYGYFWTRFFIHETRNFFFSKILKIEIFCLQSLSEKCFIIQKIHSVSQTIQFFSWHYFNQDFTANHYPKITSWSIKCIVFPKNLFINIF